MPDQGCCSMDVSRQSGSKIKLTLETMLLTPASAKLPVLLGVRMPEACIMVG